MSGGDFDQDRPLDRRDFSRRTLLAIERTYLAWWRTGLTAFAVALATARVVPELSDTTVQWPYTLLGVGFAVLGVACLVYGEQRRRRAGRAVRAGEFEDVGRIASLVITGGGLVFGAGLVLVLVIQP